MKSVTERLTAPKPRPSRRILVSSVIASVAAAVHYFHAIQSRGWSDFAPIWTASRLALSGRNPYELLGPDKPIWSKWPMYYPAPTFVVAAPFALIPSFHVASTVFVFVCTILLAWGATRDGWHRLPIFPSIAFFTSAGLAQWSILMTAMVYLPYLAFLSVGKPQNAAPVVGSSTDKRHYISALFGAAVILLISFILIPSWPRSWMSLIGTTDNFVPPVMRFGGFLILIVALRWRRPEAWLVLIASLMPQTWPPYNGLILFTVARTYYEFSALSLISSTSWVMLALLTNNLTEAQERTYQSAVLNLFGYLPAVIMILRRPNEGIGPLWLSWITEKFRRTQDAPGLDA